MKYAPLLALLTVGCAADTIDGVWQFSMQATGLADDICTENISHNFTFGWVPNEGGEEDESWTESDAESHSDQVFYGLITSTGPDAATLIIGTDAYPGVHEADGAWTFTWTAMSSTSDEQSHETGYAYSATSDQTREVVIEIQHDGDVINGTTETNTSSVENWTESDGWRAEPMMAYLGGDGTTGQIPSATYLVTEDDDPKTEGTIPQYNDGELFDCDAEDCMLNRMITCAESWPIDAVRTSLSTGEDYEGVVGAGQASGY
jgi:hypothetical protein